MKSAKVPPRIISVRSLVIAILITAGLTSAFWAAILLWQLSPNKPNGPSVGMRIETPERVKVGNAFDVKVIFVNHDKVRVYLTALAFDDSLLKGIDILSVQPEFYTQFEQQSSRVFKFGNWLNSGSSVYTFRLQPKTKKVFKGEIAAYSGGHSVASATTEIVAE